MSDLLQIGASGIRAFNTAMSAISENVSNASTTGYSRRVVSFQEAPASGVGNGGNLNGVVVLSVGRASDDYLSASARTAASSAAAASTYYNWTQKTEDAMSDDAAGVGQSATTIFTSGDALAANPGDTSSRTAFLNAIQSTTSAFNNSAQSLAQASSDIGSAAESSVETVNSTLNSLDSINTALHSAPAGTAAQANLLDQRDNLLSSLSGEIGIDVSAETDGSVTVKTSSGIVLATPHDSGARLALSTNPSSDGGRISVTAVGTNDETPVANIGGNLGGLVQSGDLVASQRVSLDTLASSFASQLNAWSAQGTDANGAAGGTLVSGATAATLGLATTDPTKVPAANSSATNGNLLTLSSLRGDDGVERQWSAQTTDLGRTVDAAKTNSDAATTRSQSAASALSDVSSVDLDTEAANLIKYQQAYSGAAKVIQAARDTMQALLDVI